MFQIFPNDYHDLRSNNLILSLWKPLTNDMKRSFSYAVAKIYNSQSIEDKANVTATNWLNMFQIM